MDGKEAAAMLAPRHEALWVHPNFARTIFTISEESTPGSTALLEITRLVTKLIVARDVPAVHYTKGIRYTKTSGVNCSFPISAR